MRAKIHYVFTVLVLTYYSAVVCPYITNLTVPTRLTIFISAFAPMYLLRIWLLKVFVHNAPYLSRVKRQYFLELGLFATAGALVTIYDLLTYSFPVTSGLKVILGTLALGFFAATDLSIEHERKLYEHLKETGEDVKISGRYVPLPIKFLTVAINEYYFYHYNLHSYYIKRHSIPSCHHSHYFGGCQIIHDRSFFCRNGFFH